MAKPVICSKEELYIPECGDCAVSCQDFNDYVKEQEARDEAQDDEIAKKENRLVAGDNVNIERGDDTTTITANVPVYVAGENVTIEIDETDPTKRIISATGGGGGSCSATKDEILSALGVRELEATLTDTGGNTGEWYLLGRFQDEEVPEVTIDDCCCTKDELLSVLGYREVEFSLIDTEGTSNDWVLLGRPKED